MKKALNRNNSNNNIIMQGTGLSFPITGQCPNFCETCQSFWIYCLSSLFILPGKLGWLLIMLLVKRCYLLSSFCFLNCLRVVSGSDLSWVVNVSDISQLLIFYVFAFIANW